MSVPLFVPPIDKTRCLFLTNFAWFCIALHSFAYRAVNSGYFRFWHFAQLCISLHHMDVSSGINSGKLKPRKRGFDLFRPVSVKPDGTRIQSPNWCVRFQHQGKRTCRSLHTADYRLAAVVFSRRSLQAMGLVGVRNPFKELCVWLRAHGVRDFKPVHYLRKCFGSLAVADHGIFIASKLLGHSDIGLTASTYAGQVDKLPAVKF